MSINFVVHWATIALGKIYLMKIIGWFFSTKSSSLSYSSTFFLSQLVFVSHLDHALMFKVGNICKLEKPLRGNIKGKKRDILKILGVQLLGKIRNLNNL